MTVAFAIVVRDDVVGFAAYFDGIRRLLHIDGDGAARAEFVDQSYLQFLWPHQSPFVRIRLGDNDVAVLVRGVDGGHAFLLDPHIAELAYVGCGCCHVEGCHQFIPGGIAEEVVVQVVL